MIFNFLFLTRLHQFEIKKKAIIISSDGYFLLLLLLKEVNLFLNISRLKFIITFYNNKVLIIKYFGKLVFLKN